MRGGFANILPASRETAHGIKQLRMAAPPIVSFAVLRLTRAVGPFDPALEFSPNPIRRSPFGTGVPHADGRLLLPSRHGFTVRPNMTGPNDD